MEVFFLNFDKEGVSQIQDEKIRRMFGEEAEVHLLDPEEEAVGQGADRMVVFLVQVDERARRKMAVCIPMRHLHERHHRLLPRFTFHLPHHFPHRHREEED